MDLSGRCDGVVDVAAFVTSQVHVVVIDAGGLIARSEARQGPSGPSSHFIGGS